MVSTPITPTFAQQFLPPGRDFLSQAAQQIHAFLAQARSQGFTQQGWVLLPTAVQLVGMRQALASTAWSGASDFLPRLLTLSHALQETWPSGRFPRSTIARLLAVQQVLQQQAWLRPLFGAESETALWGLAQAIESICAELTEVWLLPHNAPALLAHSERLEQALARSYQRLHQRVLGQEAELISTFWRFLTQDNDPQVHRWRSMQALAQDARQPVVWCSPTAPTRLEQLFLQQLAERVPVLCLSYAWAPITSELATLLHVWPECARADAELTADVPCQPLDTAYALQLCPSQGLEAEAQSAAQVLYGAAQAGQTKLALVAQDRIVARRVRALLARAGLPVRDETGWKLSTTRAAASLMAWLDVVQEGLWQGPSSAALLDFLKSPFTLHNWPQKGVLVAALEDTLRREAITGGWRKVQGAVKTQAELTALLAHLHDQATQWCTPSSRTLAEWTVLLHHSFDALGMRSALQGDAAGEQLLAALAQIYPAADAMQTHSETQQLGQTPLSRSAWRALLSLQMEQAAFHEPLPNTACSVTILPLNGLRMRQFETVVMVGCDAAQLPSSQPETLFFSNTLRRELGLLDRQERHAQQARDLAEMLLNHSGAGQQVVCTWQTRNTRGEPQRLSPWLERLQTDARWPTRSVVLPASSHSTTPQSVAPPQPRAAQLAPTQLSPSAYNALRRCPYQFFAQKMLGLHALDEMSDDLAKSEVGTWLHKILFDFHQALAQQAKLDNPARQALLEQCSAQVFNEAIKADGHALRYWHRWQHTLPSYLQWLTAQENAGWQWQAGELDERLELSLENGASLTLKGRLDRVDAQVEGEATGSEQVLDYKFQSTKKIKEKLKQAGEDCQLPFYALLRPSLGAAAWLALEEKAEAIPLPDLAQQSAWLAQQIVTDVARIYANEALPALGDAQACQWCEMRGVCRKGAW